MNAESFCRPPIRMMRDTSYFIARSSSSDILAGGAGFRKVRPPMKRISRTVGLSAALFALISVASAHAATFTWDGGGSTTAWSDDLNWAGNVQPANNGTADIVFGPTNKVMTVVNQNWNINSLVFNNDAPGIQFVDDASTSLTIQASTGFGIGLDWKTGL